MLSDIDIARSANILPVEEIGAKLGISTTKLFQHGNYKAKVDLDYLNNLKQNEKSKLILVTGITPTPAGEGKTTTTVGLGDALTQIGKKTVICLREPSLGPCFGMKGGAAGGGYAQVVPMEDINLHFTGDFHAISAAHNLLSAMLDNHIYWGNTLSIDSRRIQWRRVVDMNDRALRTITQSLGGVTNGFPREDGFDITVASEVMAIFCLSESLSELKDRLGRIVVAENKKSEFITAQQLESNGAMTVLLKDALMPNLVQTMEGTPAFVHGGPFANIAHGCSSVVATKAALKLADYVVTEAGFGSDLGAEKFFNIKCRKAGLSPDCVVLVATIRALKMHGGAEKDQLSNENVNAVSKGLKNLKRHLANMQSFGVPVIVALNRFLGDTDREVEVVTNEINALNCSAIECTHWSDGGAGALSLSNDVVRLIDTNNSRFKFLYELQTPLWEKIETIARNIYGAGKIQASSTVRKKLESFEKNGFSDLPICMAKTPLSFSADPTQLGAPEGYEFPVMDVRLSAGAGFIVVICGQILTMPGLPRLPAANNINIGNNGNIMGLF